MYTYSLLHFLMGAKYSETLLSMCLDLRHHSSEIAHVACGKRQKGRVYTDN